MQQVIIVPVIIIINNNNNKVFARSSSVSVMPELTCMRQLCKTVFSILLQFIIHSVNEFSNMC